MKKMVSYGMSHSVVWCKFANYSEECTATIFRVKVKL